MTAHTWSGLQIAAGSGKAKGTSLMESRGGGGGGGGGGAPPPPPPHPARRRLLPSGRHPTGASKNATHQSDHGASQPWGFGGWDAAALCGRAMHTACKFAHRLRGVVNRANYGVAEFEQPRGQALG